MKSATLSVSVGCPPINVYIFASNPENLPVWATGFARSVRRANGEWIAETARGPVKVMFVARNDYGILDHYVTPAGEGRILVPMRVVPNGFGSEVIITLFQQPDMTDFDFVKESELVRRDLNNLKTVLERACVPVAA